MRLHSPEWRFLLTGLLATYLLVSPTSTYAILEPVRLQLRYAHQFQFAGYYAAQWQGYYEAAGLDVEILSGIRPDGTMLRPTDAVSTGAAEFGIGAGDIVIANDQGAQLIILASIFQQSPVAVFTRADIRLSSPADLTSLKVLAGQSPLVDAEVLAMLQAEGIDPTRLTLIRDENLMSVASSWHALAQGNIDALVGYTFSIPWYAQEQQINITYLRPSVYGVDFYGDTLFTHQELVNNNPELVDKFIAASIAGWSYAMNNPEEIIGRISEELAGDPTILDVLGYNRFLYDNVRNHMLYPIVEIGHINAARWEGMHAALKSSGLVKGTLNISSLIYDPEARNAARIARNRTAIIFSLSALSLFITLFLLNTQIRARRERKLHRIQEERLLAILNATPDFVGIADKDEHVIYINQAGRKMLGLKPEEPVTGIPISTFHPADINECIARECLPQARQEGVWSGHSAILSKDGREIPVSQIVIAHKTDHGDISYYSTIARDITQQKLLEQRIHRHLHYLSTMDRITAIFLDAPDIKSVIDNILDEMLYIFHCDRAWLLQPYEPDEKSWKVPIERTRPEWPGAFALQTEQAITPDIAGYFHRILNCDGPLSAPGDLPTPIPTADQFSIQSMLVCALQPKPSNPWILGIHHCHEAINYTLEDKNTLKIICARIADLLSSLLIQEELRKSEEKYRTLVTHIPQRVFHKDSNSIYVSCNEHFASDHGMSSEMIIGKSDFDLQPREMAEKFRADDARIMRNGETEELIEPYMLHGELRWAQTLKTPVRDNKGTIVGVIGIYWDITQQKHNEEELIRHKEHMEELVDIRTKELTRVNKELEAFSYAVSHDLRAPLRSIEGFSNALSDDYGDVLSEPGQDYLSRIHNSVHRMRDLIDNLLSLSKVSRMDLHIGTLDLSNIAHRIATSFSEADPDRHVNIEIQDGVTAHGDLGLITIALENLFNNAWKYTRKTTNPRIEFGFLPDDGSTTYYIKDNGAGFDMNYADRLFTAFQRFHNEDDFPGTGIGLATVQRIIHRHGGRIWADARVGHGASFFFTLPEVDVMAENER